MRRWSSKGRRVRTCSAFFLWSSSFTKPCICFYIFIAVVEKRACPPTTSPTTSFPIHSWRLPSPQKESSCLDLLFCVSSLCGDYNLTITLSMTFYTGIPSSPSSFLRSESQHKMRVSLKRRFYVRHAIRFFLDFAGKKEVPSRRGRSMQRPPQEAWLIAWLHFFRSFSLACQHFMIMSLVCFRFDSFSVDSFGVEIVSLIFFFVITKLEQQQNDLLFPAFDVSFDVVRECLASLIISYEKTSRLTTDNPCMRRPKNEKTNQERTRQRKLRRISHGWPFSYTFPLPLHRF